MDATSHQTPDAITKLVCLGFPPFPIPTKSTASNAPMAHAAMQPTCSFAFYMNMDMIIKG